MASAGTHAMQIEVRTDRKDDAFEVRRRVFMDEQGYTDEFDSTDDTCVHITLYVNGDLAGCARVFAACHDDAVGGSDGSCAGVGETGSGDTDTWLVGRVAVLPQLRGLGLGARIMQAAERERPACVEPCACACTHRSTPLDSTSAAVMCAPRRSTTRTRASRTYGWRRSCEHLGGALPFARRPKALLGYWLLIPSSFSACAVRANLSGLCVTASTSSAVSSRFKYLRVIWVPSPR